MGKLLRTIADGVACRAIATENGWYAAVLVQRDSDLDFREPANAIWQDRPDSLKDGVSLADWADATADPADRQIVMMASSSDAMSSQVLAEGPGLGEPALTRDGPELPLVAWCQRGEQATGVFLYTGGAIRHVWSSPSPCRSLDVARYAGVTVVACQVSAASGPTVRVWEEQGDVLFESGGRNPKLAVTGGRLHVLYEEPSRNACQLVLVSLGAGTEKTRTVLPAGNDLNMHASMVVASESGHLFIAHEAAPMWGDDEQLGRHRDIYLWEIDPESGHVSAGPHTANGLLPVPFRAFREHAEKNATPIAPLVRFLGGKPSVLVRRFRQHGCKSFGWDIYRLQLTASGWSEPVRLSESFGPPDRDYDVLEGSDGGAILFQPVCNQLPCIRINEDAPMGFMWTEYHELLSYHPGRPFDTRIEVHECPPSERLPELTVLRGMSARYGIPPSVYDLAIDPPALEAPGAPRQLVWGNLHVHTAYSKCIAPMDGMPEEQLRYQRDHLGCRVFCLTEHTPLMNKPEADHSFDLLETEAGSDGVVLYATEPLITGEDTVYFARDRAVFERLRVILQGLRTRPDEYRAIKEMLPPKSVLVARHFDGPGGEHPDFGVESFDPDLEGTMEAMQVRGDSLMGELVCGDRKTKSTNTASKFLNAGKRVGLIAGTDHCGGYGRNHVCLTGFWVDEVTPETIWDALWNRRTIAVSKGKVAVWATCEGTPMGGGTAVPSPVRIRAWASCAQTLRRACLLRDGELLEWVDLDGTTAEVEFVDADAALGPHWYSVTVEARSGFHAQSVLAHSSPLFVTVNRE